MKRYECAVVLAPSIGSDGVESSTKKYKEIIASGGGSLTAIDDWGKRPLAYEINYHKEGYYHFYRFEAGNDTINELNRQMRIDENVIRHMIVRDDPKPVPPPREGPREGRTESSESQQAGE